MEVLSIQRFDQMCRQRNKIYVFAEEIKCLQNKDTIIQIDLERNKSVSSGFIVNCCYNKNFWSLFICIEFSLIQINHNNSLIYQMHFV